MSAKKIISHLMNLHASDDEMITIGRVLNELYEMRIYCDERRDRRMVNKAISTLSRLEHKKLNKKNC